MSTISGLIILGCWIIFLGYWLVTAFSQKATAERQSLPSALAHRIPLGFCYILLAVRRLPPPMNLRLIPDADWVLLTGALICLFGLFITLWARRTLAGNWSSDVTFKQGHELVRTGPYRFVRHPIYTGLLVMCLGTTIEIGKLRGGLALALMTVAFWIKLKQEERLMLRHFPDEYPVYQRQVKALVPFIL
jgi:protein-S-isoprenylcysteine O-methyltransferase Ste14